MAVQNWKNFNKSNFRYTRGIAPKPVTRGGAHLRGFAPGLHSVSDSTGLGIEARSPAPIALRLIIELTGRFWFQKPNLTAFVIYLKCDGKVYQFCFGALKHKSATSNGLRDGLVYFDSFSLTSLTYIVTYHNFCLVSKLAEVLRLI